jgi:hypothetical protein
LLWSLPVTWVVAARAGEQVAYVRPPASAFFESVVTVGPLREKAAIRLLKKRTADAKSRTARRRREPPRGLHRSEHERVGAGRRKLYTLKTELRGAA